jgi:cold shock CspA family protein
MATVNDALLRRTGIVKWFDSRGGFGFITILKGDENEGKDIFVHYSTLATVSSQYKYLVLGEYVEFELTKAENEKYEYFAKNVTGIRGGNLMCESRRLSSLDAEVSERGEPRPERGEVQSRRETRPERGEVQSRREPRPERREPRDKVQRNQSVRTKN